MVGVLAACSQTSRAAEIVEDFQQCNRDCRWVHNFYDRSITGTRVDLLGFNNPLGRHCECYANGTKLEGKIEREIAKVFDSANFWCGDFSTDFVCTMDAEGNLVSTTREDADDKSLIILHCGKCAACSSPKDLMVIYNTRKDITTHMTKCSTSFAKPKASGGHSRS